MKRIYALATALILLMALAIVGWGAWLNYSDENQIAKRMANRSVELTAARAARRPFAPVLSLDALRFSSEAMADAVALLSSKTTVNTSHLSSIRSTRPRCGRKSSLSSVGQPTS